MILSIVTNLNFFNTKPSIFLYDEPRDEQGNFALGTVKSWERTGEFYNNNRGSGNRGGGGGSGGGSSGCMIILLLILGIGLLGAC